MSTTTIAKRTTVEAQVSSEETERLVEHEAELIEWLSDIDAEIPEAIRKAKKARHSANTRQSYDYWFGRLRQWMEDPTKRNRMRTKPAIELSTLFPIGPMSELLIAAWISDVLLGPTDPEDAEEWVQTAAPWAPSTLNQVVAALRARSRDWQSTRWEPSDDMLETLTGFRRQLAERYRIRQARSRPGERWK